MAERYRDVKYSVLPTLAPFHNSDAKIRLLIGPFRSGKSVAAVMDMIMRASTEPGNRRTMCVRRTYRELKDTVVKTFFEWVPKEEGKWNGEDLTFTIPLPHGGTWEVLFRSAETPDDIKKLRGVELTDFWIDEAQENSEDVKFILTGRLSYPKGSPNHYFRGVLTSNPSDTEHWLYKQFVEDPLPSHAYWRQSARENPYLHKEYYDDLEAQYRDRPELKRRYVDGEWGAVFSGKPVYPEFSMEFHVAKKHLIPAQGIKINRGWDFGRTPACLFTQPHPDGTWLILRELVSDDSGIDEFADMVNEMSNIEFRGFSFEDVGDPSGASKSQTDERTCYDILASKGIYAYEAPTNALIPRRESMARQLMKNKRGKPRTLVDPRCRLFVDGMAGGYRFPEKASSGGQKMYSITPEKNKYSHICEAGEYVALTLFGWTEENVKCFREPLKLDGIGVSCA